MEQKIPKDVVLKRINDWLVCYQNTTDEYYNATQFLKDWKENNPDCWKTFQGFFKLESTEQFLQKYEEKKMKSHCRKSDNGNNQQVIQLSDIQIYSEITKKLKTNKLYNLPFYMKKKRNSNVGRSIDTYYFCKELFFEFGCWLSVDLRLDLYEIVFNDVVEYRNKLKGSFSKEFTDSIISVEPKPNYCILYSVLNKAVFGKNKNNENQRDSATEQELNLMYRIETEIITLIKYNVLKSFDDIITHIQSYYK